MVIPKILQLPVYFIDNQGVPHQGSLTGFILEHSSRHHLLRHHSWGAHSPYTTAQKVASWILKVFIMFPILTLCIAVDLLVWAFQIIKSAKVGQIGLKNHFVHLIGIIAFPVLCLGTALVGKATIILNHQLLNNNLNAAILTTDNDGSHDLNFINQCISDGAIPIPEFALPFKSRMSGAINGLDIDGLDYEMIETLFQTKALDPNGNYKTYDFKGINLSNHPWLVEAGLRNDIQLMNILLRAGANPNRIFGDSDKEESILTKLIDSHEVKDTTIYSFLKELKIKSNLIIPKNGSHPFAVAVMHNRFEIGERLLPIGSYRDSDFIELEAFLDFFIQKIKVMKSAFQVFPDDIIIRVMQTIMKGESLPQANMFFQAILNRQIDKNLAKFLYSKDSSCLHFLEKFKKNLAEKKDNLVKLLKKK